MHKTSSNETSPSWLPHANKQTSAWYIGTKHIPHGIPLQMKHTPTWLTRTNEAHSHMTYLYKWSTLPHDLPVQMKHTPTWLTSTNEAYSHMTYQYKWRTLSHDLPVQMKHIPHMTYQYKWSTLPFDLPVQAPVTLVLLAWSGYHMPAAPSSQLTKMTL